MRVYIPFSDGSSIAFDGQEFTVHKRPKDIDAVDRTMASRAKPKMRGLSGGRM